MVKKALAIDQQAIHYVSNLIRVTLMTTAESNYNRDSLATQVLISAAQYLLKLIKTNFL